MSTEPVSPLPVSDSAANDQNNQPLYRQPPHNLEAEQALLGAILVNNEAAQKVQGFLTPDHFFEPAHARIFDAVLRLIDKNQVADPVKLKSHFDRDEGLADVGGAQYLVRLAASAATIINAEDYGRLIHDLAMRRALIGIGEDMVNDAYEAEVDAESEEQIAEAEKRLFDLAEMGTGDSGAVQFSRALKEAITQIESARLDPSNLSGVDTGLRGLNDTMGGLHKSDLLILAGRPAMGKTALATNIAYNVAERLMRDIEAGSTAEESKGTGVLFFSLEMSADQLAGRILSDIANRHYQGYSDDDRISSHDMRQGRIDNAKFEAIAIAGQTLEDLPLYIDDTPALSIAQVRTRSRRMKRQHGIGLVVIDYLQLLRGSGRGTAGENRVQEISEITRGLKGLAKELQVPVVALSQLSRMVEQRENKRPMLSDLRESGSIEQDADVVMFVFREEYYKEKDQPSEHETEKMAQWMADMDNLSGKAEVNIGKQRHGPVGTIKLAFEKSTTRFSDLVEDNHLPDQRA